MKRPARNIWAEIERMLQTRIAKGPWKHVSSSEMSDQINKAFRQLKKYQEADPSDREHLDRPEINIAGIRIRWVHGHDKEVDPEDKIAKANEQCDKIAKEIAEAKPDQSVVASRYITVECMRPTASDPPHGQHMHQHLHISIHPPNII